MKLNRIAAVLAILSMAVSTVAANQVGVTGATNVVAADDLDNPGNTLLTATYDGPATIMTQYSLDGLLRSVIPETFASEAQFLIGNQTQGYGFFLETNTLEDEFDTLNVTVPAGAAMMFVQSGDEFAFLAADDFDDGPGADAVWDTLSLSFNDVRSFTDIGAFDPGTFSVDGSSLSDETVVGIYNAAGTLLGQGIFDDETPFDVPLLDSGQYYMFVGGESVQLGNGFAMTTPFDEHAGADPFEVTFNDIAVANGSLAGNGPGAIFEFTIVPEPSSLALLAPAFGLIHRCRRSA